MEHELGLAKKKEEEEEEEQRPLPAYVDVHGVRYAPYWYRLRTPVPCI